MPLGCSAVSRSPPAGKSRSRFGRARRHRCRVEDAHVTPIALPEVAPANEPEHVGWFAGQLSDGPLERHDPALTDPVPEQVGRERRVAQLADVGAGVGEAEDNSLVGEQLGHARRLVVGDVDAEPGGQVFADRHLTDDIERVTATLPGQGVDPTTLQLGEPLGLGDLAGFPARFHRLLLEVCRRPGPPRGIAVGSDAGVAILVHEVGED